MYTLACLMVTVVQSAAIAVITVHLCVDAIKGLRNAIVLGAWIIIIA